MFSSSDLLAFDNLKLRHWTGVICRQRTESYLPICSIKDMFLKINLTTIQNDQAFLQCLFNGEHYQEHWGHGFSKKIHDPSIFNYYIILWNIWLNHFSSILVSHCHQCCAVLISLVIVSCTPHALNLFVDREQNKLVVCNIKFIETIYLKSFYIINNLLEILNDYIIHDITSRLLSSIPRGFVYYFDVP